MTSASASHPAAQESPLGRYAGQNAQESPLGRYAGQNAQESPLRRYTVLNALQMGLIERDADADLRSLAEAMATHAVHSVIVRGIPGGRRWGIVSDLDLMAALRPELHGATAGQVAATDVVVVQSGDTLEHAAQLMAEHQTAHVVVTDPVTDEPVGILSSLDVARFLAS